MSVGAAAAAGRRAERYLVEHLRQAGATSPDRACAMHDLRRIQQRRLRRLIATGAIVEPQSGRYYLDEARYVEYRTQRQWIVSAVILGFILVGAAIYLLRR